jgi:hypothetical protein
MKNRFKEIEVNGVKKMYKVGYTMKEYTPWAKLLKDSPEDDNTPILGAYVTTYL